MEITSRFSISARRMSRSIIRELLKLTRKEGLISFAGGLPYPGTFPSEELLNITSEVLKENADNALQYSPTEGLPSLIKNLKIFLENRGFDTSQKELIVTSASQQSLDLVAKIFIDRGDTIVTENPSYLGAMSAFRAYGARFMAIEMDDKGMITEDLKRRLVEAKKTAGTGNEYYQNMPKFVYTIPDFQNPTGVTMSLERRKELISLAEEFDLIIIEDVPYRWLRYSGNEVPMLSSMDRENRVIGLFTFSKILSPGMRLGWLTADARIVDKIVQAKQATDLCTSAFTQSIADSFLSEGKIEQRIEQNIEIYREKRDAMVNALKKGFKGLYEIKINEPDGGLFLWLSLPERIDTDEMFIEAIDRNVAYVIGSAFYPNGGGHNTMRLNFSYPSLQEIRMGVERLCSLIREKIEGEN